MDADLALVDGAQDFGERRHVEDVAEALAVRLKQHGELRVAGGDGEQVVGAFALLPEGGATVCATAWEKQGAGGGFAELCGKEGGGAKLALDEFRGFLRLGKKVVGFGGLVGFRETDDEAVFAPHGFDVWAAGGADTAHDGHGPGRVNAGAERSEDADAPVLRARRGRVR